MESVVFDGVVLSELFTVVAKRGMSPSEVSYEAVPGRDGVIVTGRERGVPTLTLTFIVGPASDMGTYRRIREIAALLDVDTPRKLELGDDAGLYRMAMPAGQAEWRRTVGNSAVEVPFLVADAALYGKEITATVPSGGSVTFNVGGTYPAMPVVAATAAVRESSSGQWGLRLDGGDVLKFALGSSASRSIQADCQARTARVAGQATIPTLDSDWFELAPGEHTVQMHLGTGAATLTWRERWLS